MRRKTMFIAAALLIFMSGMATAQLDKILKGGGIAYLVSQFGKDINSNLNKLTKTKDRTSTYATKVVPVLSAGTGTQVGAVQIMGPPSQVDRVNAVAQIENNFRALDIRIRALIPIESKNVSNLKRVTGVGISGLIDVKL